jgi:ankyrin repeat protein
VLLAGGAEVDARSDVWTNFMGSSASTAQAQWFEHGGTTALMFAARVGDLESARHLVAAGADMNATNEWGITPLTMAVYGNFETFYVGDQERGADGRGWYRLVNQENFPSRFADAAIIEFLHEQGADPNAGREKLTGLHAAIMHRKEGKLELLLAYGADPNVPLRVWTPLRRSFPNDIYFDRTWVGATPIWLAARFGTPGMLRALVHHGADAKFMQTSAAVAGDGGDARAEAAESTTPMMAALGLSRGGFGWLPELEDPAAREAEALEKVRILVEAGGDVNLVDTEGRTALDGANDLGYASVVAFLESVGAKAGIPPTPGGGRRRR